MMNYCESCGGSDLSIKGEMIPVLIDDNMETHLCTECIPIVEQEMTVQRLKEG